MVSPVVDELKLLLCASRRCERPQMTPFPQRGKVSVHPLKVQDCVIRKRIIQFYGYLSITKTPLERVQRGRIGKASISGVIREEGRPGAYPGPGAGGNGPVRRYGRPFGH